MKKTGFLFLMALHSILLPAQDQINTYITEAQGYLANKEYKQAQMSLQDAVNEINNLIAQQIADGLPDEINGLKSEGEEVSGAGAMGFMGGGMGIMKNYAHPNQNWNTAEVQIMGNSPMMASINMFINNPGMMGAGYKSGRVGTFRTIMKTEMEDYYDDNGQTKKIRVTEIQIPLTQSMVVINARGFATEADEVAFATKLEIDKIKMRLGE